MGLFDFSGLGDVDIVSGKGICDFCSPADPVAWIYPCKSFEMPLPPGLTKMMLGGRTSVSDGDWGACIECAALIEQVDALGLARRCHRTGTMLEWQKEVVRRFFNNRIFDKPRVNVEGRSSVLYPEPVFIRTPPGDRWKPE